jgi:hypothetical protein
MIRLFIILILLAAFPAFDTAQSPAYAADPGSYDITMYAGEDYRLTLKLADSTGSDINLTGNSYAAQFRSAPAPTGSIFATYSTTVTSAGTGMISVRLSRAQTTALTGKSGLWDLKQTDSVGLVSYLLTGKCAVRPTVTR